MTCSCDSPLAAVLAAGTLLAGCANVAGPRVEGNVTYGDAKAVETLTNEFGSTDLQTIAEAMTRSLLQSRPITAPREAPVLTLAEVRNKTGEYIDTRAITEKIRNQLLKSGAVRFTTAGTDMQGQLDELQRQNQTGLYKNSGKAGWARCRRPSTARRATSPRSPSAPRASRTSTTSST